MSALLSLLLTVLIATLLAEKVQAQKGLLPELRTAADSAEFTDKTFNSEILITQAEVQAIEALEKLIKSKKNQPGEADLLYRLAELYMRRAKSGRFFDLEKKYALKLQKFGLPTQSEKKSLRESLKIYKDILNRYPKFQENDFVFFNSALAFSKLNEIQQAHTYYLQLIEKYPNSPLIPDTHMEVAEIHYGRGEFTQALDHLQSAENFKRNKVYPYAVYKSAWCLYNLRQTEKGIEKLLSVAELGRQADKAEKRYNLRAEALQDLILFVSETKTADVIIDFFHAIATPQEVATMVIRLGDLYQTHSRHRELIQLAQLYLARSDESTAIVHLSASLVSAYESLQQRDMVIKSLSDMADTCRAKIKDQVLCNDKFKEVSSEISEKWWSIWLKNKTHAEFSHLTAQVFEIQLAQSLTDSDHWNARYAYAELLFAQKKYAQAAENYKLASEIPGIEHKKIYDSLYSAIFSYEQLSPNNPVIALETQRKLMVRYHTECLSCEHWTQITSKLAHQSYKNSEPEKALTLAKLLLADKTPVEIREKNEDLILDIYNLKKDYASLKNHIEAFMKRSTSASRKKELSRLLVQTAAAEVDTAIALLPETEKIRALENFSSSFPQTEEGKKALLKSLAIALKNSYLVKAGDLSMRLASLESEPDINLLQDAAQAYTEAGHLSQAILIYKNYTVLNEKKPLALCELLELENKTQEALNCYTKKFSAASFEQKSALASTILDLMRSESVNANGIVAENFKNQLINQKIEPHTTELLTEQAESLFENGHYEKAFALSLKINSRPVEPAHRARARILQARILQKEFENQSVRTGIERLSLVLSIKTEKFDKALTAYNSALKMTEQIRERIICLEAINHLYTHFLQSLNQVSIQMNASEAEKQALSAELAPLIQIFTEKKQSNATQLELLSEDQALDRPLTAALKNFKDYLSVPGQISSNQFVITKKIDSLDSLSTAQALQLTEIRDTRSLGFYYLSILAHRQDHYRRAAWYAEKAIQLNPQFKLAYYQKARAQYHISVRTTVLAHFRQILDVDLPIKEMYLLRAAQFYHNKDFSAAQAEISKLSPSDVAAYKVESLVSEIQKNGQQKISARRGEPL